MNETDTSTRAATPAKCTACAREMKNPAVCQNCHAIQPVDDVNYFDLLGIAASYDIDPAEVRARYLNLARAVHPDRLKADTSEVRALSLRTTAQVNRARTVLLDPIQRAEYLLAMAGGKCSADDKSVPNDVLADMLTLREELEEARESDDRATIDACRGRVQQRYDDTLQRIAELARTLPGDEQTRTTLRAVLNAISYYQKLLADLEES